MIILFWLQIYKKVLQSQILNNISKSSNIVIHTPTNIGFSYINKLNKGKSAGKWINKDIGIRLSESITKNKHKVTFENYGELEQDEFIKSKTLESPIIISDSVKVSDFKVYPCSDVIFLASSRAISSILKSWISLLLLHPATNKVIVIKESNIIAIFFIQIPPLFD